jgi:hypothetical protein
LNKIAKPQRRKEILMKRFLEVNETVIIRKFGTLMGGAKTFNGKNYLRQIFSKLIESLDDLILMEICRVSQRKYQLCFVITEDNSYNVEDDNVFFTADWYDISRLKNVCLVKYHNDLFGESEELRPACESDEG